MCACLVVLCQIVTATCASAETGISYAPIARSLTLSTTPLQALVGDALPPAATRYVDGISDQSLPSWDGSFPGGYFAGFFHDTWADGGLSSHIALARYVVQWNVMSGAYPEYRAELESWYADVLELGLTPEVSLASYDGVMPRSAMEYQIRLQALLGRFTAIRYLEAWDEPNHTAKLTAVAAAGYTNSAYSLCQTHGCTVIAGNFLDSQSNMISYERAYERALHPATLPNWGIHPYAAVKTRNPSTVLAFKSNLPGGGAGKRIWFTEVGAYRCEATGRYEPRGERAQARDASWLVNRLMPDIQPAHVFYYEFLFKDSRPPPCSRTDSDTALYVPGGDPYATDIPRAAASYIYDGHGASSASAGGGARGSDRALARPAPATTG